MFGHKNPGKLPSVDVPTGASSVVSSMLDVPSLSRRVLLAAVACGACTASTGCTSRPDVSGSESARDGAEELAGAAAAASLPAGDVMWERVVCRSRSAHAAMSDEVDDSKAAVADWATTTRVHAWADRVYVGAGSAVLALDVQTGEAIARSEPEGDLPPTIGTIALTAGPAPTTGTADSLSGDVPNMVLAACGDGALRAYWGDTLEPAWSTVCAYDKALTGYSTSMRETGEVVSTPHVVDAGWNTTEVVVHGDCAFVGFSSYQVDPGSHLVCISLDDGAIVWETAYAGRFAYTGGTSQLFAADAGLLVPVPEEACVALLDYERGVEIGRVATDAPIAAGAVSLGADTVLAGEGDAGSEGLLVQSRTGTLYLLRASDQGIQVAGSVAVSTGTSDAALPGSSSPVRVGDVVWVNGARAEGEAGFVAAVDLAAFTVASTYDDYRFDATPVLVQVYDGDSWQDAALIDLGTEGLYKLELSSDGRAIGGVICLTEDVSLVGAANDVPPAISADGILYLASGTTEEQRVYAIR